MTQPLAGPPLPGTPLAGRPSAASEATGLKHVLHRRQMTMIALGGVIGAGLFVGSGVVIKSAGPAAVLSFLITGLLVVLVMRMLAEMAVAIPAVGSFYEYARLAFADRPVLGDLAGFLSGWMYWYFWVIVVALEAVAGAGLVRYWLPEAPAWLVSFTLLVALTFTNLFSVKGYGEFEFWFASIKVAAIAAFLLIGGLFVLGLWPGGTEHWSSLAANGGFAPNGVLPVLTGAVATTGFYFGAEIVTVAAAEAAEPAKAVADAAKWVISRALFFYVGSVLLVVCLVPWNSPGIAAPYVSALEAMGIHAAAQIMNAVVLTAVLSALNSGLYASSRMLFALTRHGDAPQPARHPVRLRRRGDVLCLSRYRLRVPGRFVWHRSHFRLCAHRGIAAAPPRPAGTIGSGAAAGANVGLPLSHLLHDLRDARDRRGHGLHSRPARAAGLRPRECGDFAARVHAAPPSGRREPPAGGGRIRITAVASAVTIL